MKGASERMVEGIHRGGMRTQERRKKEGGREGGREGVSIP